MPRPPASRLLLLCVALVFAGTLTACGSPSPPAGTLRLPVVGPADIPDPAGASTPQDMFLDSLLYSGLVKFSPDLHVIPELAVSIPTISNGGRTYVFTVRQDARFADGTPVTAEDIARSLTRALSPREDSAPARSLLRDIVGAAQVEAGHSAQLAGVTALHRLTLRIRLAQPDADFLDRLAFPEADVLETGKPLLLAGTGPWMVAQRSPATLRPRPHFYGGRLQVRSLILLPNAGEQLYRRGGVDIWPVPFARMNALSSHSDYQSSPGLTAYYLLPRWDGTRIAAALDRSRLLGTTAGLSPLTSIVPPAVPDYVSSPPSLDPARAPAIHVLPANSDGARYLANALRRQFPEGHIPVPLIEVTHWLPDPGLWLHVVPSQSRWYRGILRSSARLTLDPVTRMSQYSAGETWALQKGLVVPLAYGSVAYLIKPRVHGLTVTPLGPMPVNNSWTSVSLG